MPDVFDATIATYCDDAGAQAYVDKERRHEVARNASTYGLLEGVDLEGRTVLDVGCGFGRDVAFFRQRGAAAFGCDISPALLAQADADMRPFLALYDVRCGVDFLFAGPFDVVWCIAVLVHVPRAAMPDVLRRMWAAVAPGGVLILATKGGEGERVMANLGAALPRVMVYYRLADILAILEPLGAVVEIAQEKPESLIATGDWMLEVRVRKGI